MTLLSLGIWVAFPASRSRLSNLKTVSYTPGGLDLTRNQVDYFTRSQLYAFYATEIEKYSKYEENDSQKEKLEVIFQYNLLGGMTFEAIAQMNQSRDPEYMTESTEQDKFKTWLTGLSVSHKISDMFRLRVDYSSFIVRYDTDSNEFKNRDDKALSTYLFFVLSEKTELFVEYENIKVKYDNSTVSDSSQNQSIGGIEWQFTEKSQLIFKAGQISKSFDDSSTDTASTSLWELLGNHSFSAKSSMNVMTGGKIRETSAETANYVLNQTNSIGFNHFFTVKFSGRLNLVQTKDDYVGGISDDREDTMLNTSINFDYFFTDWFVGSGGYAYTKSDSTIETIGSEKNDIFLRVSALF